MTDDQPVSDLADGETRRGFIAKVIAGGALLGAGVDLANRETKVVKNPDKLAERAYAELEKRAKPDWTPRQTVEAYHGILVEFGAQEAGVEPTQKLNPATLSTLTAALIGSLALGMDKIPGLGVPTTPLSRG